MEGNQINSNQAEGEIESAAVEQIPWFANCSCSPTYKNNNFNNNADGIITLVVGKKKTQCSSSFTNYASINLTKRAN